MRVRVLWTWQTWEQSPGQSDSRSNPRLRRKRAGGVTYCDRRFKIGPKSRPPYGFQFHSKEGEPLTLAERNAWRAAAMSEAMGEWSTAQEAICRGKEEYRHNMKAEGLKNDETLSEDAACAALGVKCIETLCARLEMAAEVFEKLCESFQVIRKAGEVPVKRAILPTVDSKMSKPR